MGTEFEHQSFSHGLEIFTKNEFSMELESVNFGCIHYRRKCKIRAPNCDEIFDCRHCHNEAKDTLDIVCMGKYFCQKCKFFDDDPFDHR
ncbi:E3 ubiquitin-protein ligase RZFP34-like [Rhododendron vialii]|uniref:E3 ubiquitin-protein ligase RZFP34-like n=1 Tax=Rhododendron vialii TaxID=182163 RepID=UPI00265F03C4|nr:E3 ubiquitin-protein ligase RZFP34-like [Rhododendron vialii]